MLQEEERSTARAARVSLHPQNLRHAQAPRGCFLFVDDDALELFEKTLPGSGSSFRVMMQYHNLALACLQDEPQSANVGFRAVHRHCVPGAPPTSAAGLSPIEPLRESMAKDARPCAKDARAWAISTDVSALLALQGGVQRFRDAETQTATITDIVPVVHTGQATITKECDCCSKTNLSRDLGSNEKPLTFVKDVAPQLAHGWPREGCGSATRSCPAAGCEQAADSEPEVSSEMMTAGSPVDFCVKSGHWRDKQGRFCKAPLDVIPCNGYPAEAPLTDRSYAVGAVALLRPEKAKKEQLVGIVEVVICRATSQYVFVSSPLLSGSDLRPRKFLKSSVIRTNRMQDDRVVQKRLQESSR